MRKILQLVFLATVLSFPLVGVAQGPPGGGGGNGGGQADPFLPGGVVPDAFISYAKIEKLDLGSGKNVTPCSASAEGYGDDGISIPGAYAELAISGDSDSTATSGRWLQVSGLAFMGMDAVLNQYLADGTFVQNLDQVLVVPPDDGMVSYDLLNVRAETYTFQHFPNGPAHERVRIDEITLVLNGSSLTSTLPTIQYYDRISQTWEGYSSPPIEPDSTVYSCRRRWLPNANNRYVDPNGILKVRFDGQDYQVSVNVN